MLITVYQTNTGHRAVSFYHESNAQNKFTFKCWSCHASNIVQQLSSFSLITHQYIMFAPLCLHLKHFETSALLCVVKRILLDIGFNVIFPIILQISNFQVLRSAKIWAWQRKY